MPIFRETSAQAAVLLQKKPAVSKTKLSGPMDLSAVDLRVGIILRARKHENAESLYVEDIDVGEEIPRQVITASLKA